MFLFTRVLPLIVCVLDEILIEDNSNTGPTVKKLQFLDVIVVSAILIHWLFHQKSNQLYIYILWRKTSQSQFAKSFFQWNFPSHFCFWHVPFQTWATLKLKTKTNPSVYPTGALRAYIKDAIAYCKQHGLVKSLGLFWWAHIIIIRSKWMFFSFGSCLRVGWDLIWKLYLACIYIYSTHFYFQQEHDQWKNLPWNTCDPGVTNIAQKCFAILWSTQRRNPPRNPVLKAISKLLLGRLAMWGQNIYMLVFWMSVFFEYM